MSTSAAYDNVEIASKEEFDAGVRAALESLGLTFEELAALAEEDSFPSERARLLWFVLAPRDGAAC